MIKNNSRGSAVPEKQIHGWGREFSARPVLRVGLNMQTVDVSVSLDRMRMLLCISKKMNSIPNVSSTSPQNSLTDAWERRVVFSREQRRDLLPITRDSQFQGAGNGSHGLK